jgi:hypothetical protein
MRLLLPLIGTRVSTIDQERRCQASSPDSLGARLVRGAGRKLLSSEEKQAHDLNRPSRLSLDDFRASMALRAKAFRVSMISEA